MYVGAGADLQCGGEKRRNIAKRDLEPNRRVNFPNFYNLFLFPKLTVLLVEKESPESQ